MTRSRCIWEGPGVDSCTSTAVNKRSSQAVDRDPVQTGVQSPQLWRTSVVLGAMRRIAISTIPALALLLAAASPSTARVRHTTASPCPPAKSHVLLADAEAELYIVKEHLPPFPEPERVVRGCTYGQKRSYLLGEAEEHVGGSEMGGSTGVKLETLAGSIVAYTKSASYGSNESRHVVVVRNLSSGRILHQVTTSMLKPEVTSGSVGPTTAIVVKSDGAVAWIIETGYPGDVEYRVYAIDKSGRRLLASSADIVPYSLALAENTLYWTQGGQSFSASLD
jgi:hypothetical protein